VSPPLRFRISVTVLLFICGKFRHGVMHIWVQLYTFFILATDGVGVQSQGSRLVTTHVTHGLVAVLNVVMQTCCEPRLDSHKD